MITSQHLLLHIKSHITFSFHSKTNKWRNVTPGFLLVWFGILCILGASRIRTPDLAYESKYGLSIPLIQNACTRDSFRQIRQYIHFIDNETMKTKQHPQYHPLQKIKWIIDIIQHRLQTAYCLGKKISLDEAMILCKSKYVSFVQYMPQKPIKHGIKVFALCCAYTGFLYAFVIYTGKDNVEKMSTSLDVVKYLIELSGIIATGRIVYTDSYYTSLEVLDYVYRTWSMLMVGTIALTKKVSRTAADFPFPSLSNAALRLIPRGWCRTAFQEVYHRSRHLYTVQATIWKDKKLVGFLHNHLVEPEVDSNVLRYSPRKKRKKKIQSHNISKDYSMHMNGVDTKDRDTADWSVSLKSFRYYMRLFYWLFDGVLHAMYTLIKLSANDKADTNDKWWRYCHMKTGRFEFQMDLGIQLINHGLSLDWVGDPSDRHTSTPPVYVRRKDYIPCACNVCFFCNHGLTYGVAHPVLTKSGSKKRYRNNSDRPVIECTGERKLMGKTSSTRMCCVCYYKRKQDNPSNKSSKELRRGVPNTKMGCKKCNKYVCNECWDDFKHGFHY